MIIALFVLQLIVITTLAVFLSISITNIWSLQRLGKFHPLSHYPKISVLIPARNEAHNIEKCVTSILNQTYPDYEVLVLNDNSTDNTWEIINQINNPKLNVFQGKPLPEDWLGKHWACHQLVQKANGKLLLFIDADTHYQPDCLTTAVEAMAAENADFITVLPKEEAHTLAEKLTLPIISWSLV